MTIKSSDGLGIRFRGNAEFDVTFKVTYKFRELEKDFDEWMGDHEHTLSALEEFILDRFIAPNFDNTGKLTIEVRA